MIWLEMLKKGYSKYDTLLKQARGSAIYWIPQLCLVLKEENSNISNDDIRDRVMKDCISIWQKDTIRKALPDEYKDKQKQEAARISHRIETSQVSLQYLLNQVQMQD